MERHFPYIFMDFSIFFSPKIANFSPLAPSALAGLKIFFGGEARLKTLIREPVRLAVSFVFRFARSVRFLAIAT